jgi:hypothetical protein
LAAIATQAVQQFAGDGSTTAFTLNDVPAGDVLVTVDGVPQATSEYAVTDTILTLGFAAVAGAVILVVYVVTSASILQGYVNQFTGDSTTTAFTLGASPFGAVFVTIDGVPQALSQYAVSGQTLTVATAPASGATILIWYIGQI